MKQSEVIEKVRDALAKHESRLSEINQKVSSPRTLVPAYILLLETSTNHLPDIDLV